MIVTTNHSMIVPIGEDLFLPAAAGGSVSAMAKPSHQKGLTTS